MKRKPRDPDAPLLGWPLIIRICIAGILLLIGTVGLFEWELLRGNNIEAARTIAVNVIVFGEIFYLFNCRSLQYPFWKIGVFSNPLIWMGIIAMSALQLLFTYAPFMQQAFGTASLGVREWLLLINGGIVLFFIIEIEKEWHRRLSDK